jgi:hypothetical protein
MRGPAPKLLATAAVILTALVAAAPSLATPHLDGSAVVSATASAGAVTEYEPEGAFPETVLGRTRKSPIRTTARAAKVKFTFTSPNPGARFQCSLAKEIPRKGKKSRLVGRAFHKCVSPKTYRLKPGNYRFEVRAVVGSEVDPRPSRFGFKVVHIVK